MGKVNWFWLGVGVALGYRFVPSVMGTGVFELDSDGKKAKGEKKW